VEYHTYEGTWWLPERPAVRIPGTFKFDATGSELILRGSFDQPEKVTDTVVRIDPREEILPLLHGYSSDGKPITLLHAQGTILSLPIGQVENFYLVDMEITGTHCTEDIFTELQCEFDCLTAWARPPSLAEFEKPFDTLNVRFRNTELERARVGDTEICLVASVRGNKSANAVNVEQAAVFTVTTQPTSMGSMLDQWVRPLHDLLTFALGRPVRMTSLLVRQADSGKMGDVSFAPVQREDSHPPTWSSLASRTSPTVFTLSNSQISSPIPFDVLIPQWFSVRSELRTAVSQLVAPYSAPFMFSEHRYASIFQAAESIATLRFGGREKSKTEHRARVEAVTQALQATDLDEKTRGWAIRILNSRNDKTLSQQIQSLIGDLGAVGEAITQADPGFAETVASARTGVSHPKTNQPLSAIKRHWYGEVLTWLVRSYVLLQLGWDLADVENRVLEREPLRRALHEIREIPSSPTNT
jgi:hypothetical protein